MICRASANMSWRTLTGGQRSEEHTSELQSQSNLVCRLLLEKKKHVRPASASSCTPLSTPSTHLALSTPARAAVQTPADSPRSSPGALLTVHHTRNASCILMF